MITVCFPSDLLAHYRAYTLCCHTLLASYDHLSTACDIDALVERFDSELYGSYCKQYPLTIDSVKQALNKLVNKYATNPLVHNELKTARHKILTNAEKWDFTGPLEDLRDIGKGLAQDFYSEGGRDKNRELINSHDPKLILSNEALSDHNPDPSTTPTQPRPIMYWCSEIHLPFDHAEFKFCQYLSYPFLFFHEYASHVYAPRIDSRTFDDGWMMYAIELFIKTQWQHLSQKYPLIPAQRDVLSDIWLPDPGFSNLAKRGYKYAREVRTWTENRFLDLTWDLASYPANFAGTLSFHDDFIDVIRKYITRAKAPLLQSIAADSPNAYQLYLNLKLHSNGH